MNKKDKQFRKMEQEAAKPAVLFDFDGTLMDTDTAVIAAYREIFDRYKKGNEFNSEVESEALTAVPEVMMKKYFPRRSTAKCVQELLDYQEQHLNDLIQRILFDEAAGTAGPCVIDLELPGTVQIQPGIAPHLRTRIFRTRDIHNGILLCFLNDDPAAIITKKKEKDKRRNAFVLYCFLS